MTGIHILRAEGQGNGRATEGSRSQILRGLQCHVGDFTLSSLRPEKSYERAFKEEIVMPLDSLSRNVTAVTMSQVNLKDKIEVLEVL